MRDTRPKGDGGRLEKGVRLGPRRPDIEAEEVKQSIPGARVLAIPDAGHFVLVEQPEVGTAAITEFIREAEAA